MEDYSDLVTESSVLTLFPGQEICYILTEETLREVSKLAQSRTGFYFRMLHIFFNFDDQSVVDLRIPDENNPRKQYIRRFTRRDCCVEVVGEKLPFRANTNLTPVVKRSGVFYGVPEIIEPSQGDIAALG
jgi:hypothetical protein